MYPLFYRAEKRRVTIYKNVPLPEAAAEVV
jgi:hypothetical protein